MLKFSNAKLTITYQRGWIFVWNQFHILKSYLTLEDPMIFVGDQKQFCLLKEFVDQDYSFQLQKYYCWRYDECFRNLHLYFRFLRHCCWNQMIWFWCYYCFDQKRVDMLGDDILFQEFHQDGVESQLLKQKKVNINLIIRQIFPICVVYGRSLI